MIETFSKDLTKVLIIFTLIMFSIWLLDPPNPMIGTWEYAGNEELEEDLPSTFFDIIEFHPDGTFTRNVPTSSWTGTFKFISNQVYLYYEQSLTEVYIYDEELNMICRETDLSLYRKVEDQNTIFNNNELSN